MNGRETDSAMCYSIANSTHPLLISVEGNFLSKLSELCLFDAEIRRAAQKKTTVERCLYELHDTPIISETRLNTGFSLLQ